VTAAEQLARTERGRLALGDSAPVTDLLRSLERDAGVQVALCQLGEHGLAGMYQTRDGVPVILVNSSTHPVRARFTLAHEYGHHRLGHVAAVDRVVDPTSRDRREVEANQFAAELLLPRPRDGVVAAGRRRSRGGPGEPGPAGEPVRCELRGRAPPPGPRAPGPGGPPSVRSRRGSRAASTVRSPGSSGCRSSTTRSRGTGGSRFACRPGRGSPCCGRWSAASSTPRRPPSGCTWTGWRSSACAGWSRRWTEEVRHG